MCSLKSAPTIKTSRLTLRPLMLGDAAAIAEYAADLDVARMTSRMPHPFGIDDAVSFIERVADPASIDQAVFSIRDKGNGLIGVLGFHNSDDDPAAVEIGYWLGKPWWGQGLATEAVRGALVWAKDGWGKRFVRASHFADNPASGAVLIKAGFLYTGEVKALPSLARGGPAATRQMVWLA